MKKLVVCYLKKLTADGGALISQVGCHAVAKKAGGSY
jgi:hypothetical protein